MGWGRMDGVSEGEEGWMGEKNKDGWKEGCDGI
jgi:hypothetical protein